MLRKWQFMILAFMTLIVAGCIGEGGRETEQIRTVKVDGSSTVFPITEAVGEEFQKLHGNVRVTVGISGTGGGFKKFCNGETDISDASRPIKPSEVDLCKNNGIEHIELPVAFDGLSVMVNPQNDWADCITTAELQKIWAPEAQGKITKWNQIRPEWPDSPLRLYGAGVDSGTYDYFTEAIVGLEHSSRGDFTSSEDDNVLVQGIYGDRNALGFFGYAYYVENKDKLKLVAIDDGNDENGKGCVLPSETTINEGTYQPLSRPIFIYVNKMSAERSEINEFVRFYLTSGKQFVGEVGYVRLPDAAYDLALKRFEAGVVGSVFGGKGSQVGVKIEDLLTSVQ